MVAGRLARSGHHTRHLEAGGLTAGLLTATVERGVLLASAGRAETSVVDQIAGAAYTDPKGTEEVPRIAIVRLFDRCDLQ